MVITIGETEYTRFKNLSFAPQTDVAGTQLPINQFSAELNTSDDISTGADATLEDDMGRLWAYYRVVNTERLDKATVRITAQSRLHLLELRTMPAKMYNNIFLASVLSEIFDGFPSGAWYVDPEISTTPVTGYCPEQSARDRLLWAVFVCGAYVKTWSSTVVEIRPIDDTESLVPMDRTFWRPSLTYGEWVTSLRVRAYSFASGTPEVTDEWVKAGNSVWLVSWQDYTLANPSAPETADPNEVAVEGVMLVNADNVNAILNHLSRYYFDRLTVEADVINNREYEPGQKLTVYTREDQLVTGFVSSADFSFGVQARSRLQLVAAEVRETGKLTITYLCEGRRLDRKTLFLPVGYAYSITNPYFDLLWTGERVVYRPLTEAAEGVIASGSQTQTVEYAKALIFTEGVLDVISVDSVSMDGGDVIL